MSIEEFIKNLSKEDLEKINTEFAKKENKIPIYQYSKIRDIDLRKLFNIEKSIERDVFNSWFKSDLKLSKDTIDFLDDLLKNNEILISSYKEEDLKMKFISKILNKVNFLSYENKFREFYEESLIYETENFVLNGTTDFVVAKGLFYSQKPYFFIQEFKRNKTNSDPEPQLVAELISAIELNNWKTIKGAYIIGSIWNFVILKRFERHKYEYFVSQNFDSTKIEDLKGLYRNLLFVKQEIIEMIERGD